MLRLLAEKMVELEIVEHWSKDSILYPYPLSRQKTAVLKVDLSPCVKAGGTEGVRRATAVPPATPYASAGVR